MSRTIADLLAMPTITLIDVILDPERSDNAFWLIAGIIGSRVSDKVAIELYDIVNRGDRAEAELYLMKLRRQLEMDQ